MPCVTVPEHLFSTSSGRETVSYLESLEVGDEIRIETRENTQTANFRKGTARKMQSGWDLVYDDEASQSYHLENDEETVSLHNCDSWVIGYYRFEVPPSDQPPQPQPQQNPVRTIALECANYELGGLQTNIEITSGNGILPFRLYTNVCYAEIVYLKTLDLVRLYQDDKQVHVYFYTAAPVIDNIPQEDESGHLCLIFNASSGNAEFVPLKHTQKVLGSDVTIQYDRKQAETTVRAFLKKPFMMMFQFDPAELDHGADKGDELPSSHHKQLSAPDVQQPHSNNELSGDINIEHPMSDVKEQTAKVNDKRESSSTSNLDSSDLNITKKSLRDRKAKALLCDEQSPLKPPRGGRGSNNKKIKPTSLQLASKVPGRAKKYTNVGPVSQPCHDQLNEGFSTGTVKDAASSGSGTMLDAKATSSMPKASAGPQAAEPLFGFMTASGFVPCQPPKPAAIQTAITPAVGPPPEALAAMTSSMLPFHFPVHRQIEAGSVQTSAPFGPAPRTTTESEAIQLVKAIAFPFLMMQYYR